MSLIQSVMVMSISSTASASRCRSPVHLGRVPAVMTVPNLNFLRYPHLYSLSERLIALRLYRRALRQAQRVITVSTPAREELSERLSIDLRRSRS